MSTPTATDTPPVLPEEPRPAKRLPRPRQPETPPAHEPAPVKRKRPRIANTNRAYYLGVVGPDGRIDRLFLRLPTIGQARKHKPMACQAAGLSEANVRIVRAVIVD